MGTYTYISTEIERENHFPIHQKLTQYCKSNTHQQPPKNNLTSDFIVVDAKSRNI